MMTATTPNRGWPLPNNGSATGNVDLNADIQNLIDAFLAADGDVQSVVSGLAGKATLDSPTFTGLPSAPTAPSGDDSSLLANTAFVTAAISVAIANLIASSPSTLDTLNELAAALGDDPNFATTVATQLGLKANTEEMNTLLAQKASLTGAEELTNKTLTTPVLKLKNSAGALPTDLGELQWDTTTGRLKVGTGSATKEHAANNEEFIAEYDLTGLSYIDIPNLGAFKTLKLETVLQFNTANSYPLIRVSNNNGASFDSSASYLAAGRGMIYNGSAVDAATSVQTGIILSVAGCQANLDVQVNTTISKFNKAVPALFQGLVTFPAASGWASAFIGGRAPNTTVSCNAIRFIASTGAFTGGYLSLKGIRG